MNGAERDELRELTRQLADFQVAVTKVLVPRDELDRRESSLRDRISRSENRGIRLAVSLGALNVAGWASLLLMLAAR
jgi:hypothetical protein